MTEPHLRFVELIRGADAILVFTGAGISTASGIPDYRGPQGVWKSRRPVYYQEFLDSEAAQVEYWDFKLEGWPAIRDAEPNAVHAAVVELQERGKLHTLVTQNVDGLHGRAGIAGGKLVEIHGSDSSVLCQSCGAESAPEPHYEFFRREGTPPLCECGGLLKPATISFGQSLRTEDLERAFQAAEEADLAISLGSTLSVHPAASVPLTAARRGVPYVVVNRGETDHDGVAELTLRMDGDVGEIFPRAVREALS